jgi:hypothetical protein
MYGVYQSFYVWCLPIGPTLGTSDFEKSFLLDSFKTPSEVLDASKTVLKLLWNQDLAKQMVTVPTRSDYMNSSQITYCIDRPISTDASMNLIDVYNTVMHAIKAGNSKGVCNRVLSALNYKHIYKLDILSELMSVLKIVYLEVSVDHFTVISKIAGDIQYNIDITPEVVGRKADALAAVKHHIYNIFHR